MLINLDKNKLKQRMFHIHTHIKAQSGRQIVADEEEGESKSKQEK